MDKKMNVVISTDGACSGNPGPGGYAAVLRIGSYFKELAGFESMTTNSRMELRAVVAALAAVKKPCIITVRSDSTMVCNAIANLDSMPTKGWKTKSGARRANCDLLEQMYKIKHEGNHELFALYTKGHNGDPDNERCDYLAKEQILLNVR